MWLGWPNLFVVGAPRCGTTAIYEYLRRHPDVFMTPAKEPGFMAIDGALFDLETRQAAIPSYFVTTIDGYRALFRHWHGEKIRGEATPHYLHHPAAPLRMHHYAPDAHVVAILRSPAARAHSSYMANVRDGAEYRTFDQAMMAALNDPCMPAMLAGSFYAEGIARYRKLFGSNRVLVLLTEDLEADAPSTMKRLFAFLDIPTDLVSDLSSRPNSSGVPRSRSLHRLVNGALDHRLMKHIHRWGPSGFGQRLETWRSRYYERGLTRLTLPLEQERFYNRAIFSSDIDRLQGLIGRDLSHWIT